MGEELRVSKWSVNERPSNVNKEFNDFVNEFLIGQNVCP